MEIFCWETSPRHAMRTATQDSRRPRFLLEARFLRECISHSAEVVSALVESTGMMACDYRWGVVSSTAK